jgi:hypothetical protein
LVEIVRALDILGAETILKEYEALLYLQLSDFINNDKESEERFKGFALIILITS